MHELGDSHTAAGPVTAWRVWWLTRPLDATPLAVLARRQGFVLTTKQLRAAGWTDHDLRREVRRGHWWLPARGTASPIVVEGDGFDARRRRHAIRSAAAALVRRDCVVSGPSAAILHGLPTVAIPAVPQLTSLSDDWLGRRAGSHLRHAGLMSDDRSAWFGLPVTSVCRTVVDLGRHDRRTALMAADAALREQCTTRDALDAALARARGWPGVRTARQIIALADPNAESPLESVVRLALHDDGFPQPLLQRVIAGYRVDFIWPHHRLILEADGRGKYREDELWREKLRETALRRAGFEVERVLWSDIFGGWDVLRERLRSQLRSRAPSPSVQSNSAQ